MQLTERHGNGYESSAAALLQCEQERCRALLERDYEALKGILDDGLVHTHSTGEIHDKLAYLKYVRGPSRLLEVKRGDLDVQVFDNVALMSGSLANTIQPPAPIAAVTVHTHVTQVWLRNENHWRLRAFHATRVAAPGISSV